jgi:hypothetical protein
MTSPSTPRLDPARVHALLAIIAQVKVALTR